MVTDYDDGLENIFKEYGLIQQTKFSCIFYDEYGFNYSGQCLLFKPKNEKIRIFCVLFDKLMKDEQNLTIKTVNFTYYDYTIVIYSKNSIKVNRLDYDISFLYSVEQTINVNETENSYEMKFDIAVYNNELLYLYGETNNTAVFDSCERRYNDITFLYCYISKEKISELLTKNNEQFKLGIVDENIGSYTFDDVKIGRAHV